MMPNGHWRLRPGSKGRRVALALHHAKSSLKTHSFSRAHQLYHFFADFWESTPHPVAQMSFVVGWAAVVATVNDDRVLEAGVILDSAIGKAITTILSFLIVFRTNQSYNRWWEGRVLWGKMHWSCVELAQEAATWIEDRRLAIRVMNFSIAFAYAVKQILRRKKLIAQHLDGIIEPAEVAAMNRLSPTVVPYYCTDVIRQCTKKGLTERPQKHGAQAVARGIDLPVSRLAQQFADMARVRNTPQPDAFRVMLHMFTVIYLLLLPVISYDALGLWVVPEVFLTSFLMLGLQLAARDLEDPFGYDLSDLDLDMYMDCIIKQCREAFYLGEKGGNDLTLPPVEAKVDSANADPTGTRGGRAGGEGSGTTGTNKDGSSGARCCDGFGAGGRKRKGRGGGGRGSSIRRVGGANKGGRGGSGGGGGGRGGERSPSKGEQTTPSLVASAPPSVSPVSPSANVVRYKFIFGNGGGRGGGGGTAGNGGGGGGGGGVDGRSLPTLSQNQQPAPLGDFVL